MAAESVVLLESKVSLYCQYGLIAGQHLLTLVTRIGLPYLQLQQTKNLRVV